MFMQNLGERCRMCGSLELKKLFSADFRQFRLDYFECSNCSYVQTQKPSWLHIAYSDVINDSDVGLIRRNKTNARLTAVVISLLGLKNPLVLDACGGNGMLTRILRDYGFNAYWSDPYCQNMFANRFEKKEDQRFDICTSFEAFEHFVDPLEDIQKLFECAPSIFFSTMLIPDPAPNPIDWWYYGLDHGQHIGFYRIKTLEFIARHYGKSLYTDGNQYHLLSNKKISPFAMRIFCFLSRSDLFLKIFKKKSLTIKDYEFISRSVRLG